MIRTRWFSSDCKPVRIGAYEVRLRYYTRLIVYSWWDGSSWGVVASTPHSAKVIGTLHKSMYRPSSWRGLLKETSK